MPSLRSAALLVYRRRGGLEFLLAHPGGPYWRNRDLGAWSIPKGLMEEGEEGASAARREFAEETGLEAPRDLEPLTPRRQPSGKLVLPWMTEADLDLSQVRSGLFDLEWRPRSGRWAQFPEVDEVAYFGLMEALAKIHSGQAAILQEAAERLRAGQKS